MKWDDLQYVLAVAEAGSVAAGAKILNVHHATVLRRITDFEQRCGVRLFDRRASGYRLTPESSHVLSSIRNIAGLVDDLGRAIASQDHDITGLLRLTTTDSLANSVVLAHITEFCAQHPGMQVELMSRNDHLDFSRLEADISIRPAINLPDELEGTYICDLGMRVYASPDYLETAPYEDVGRFDWLGVSGPLTRVPFHAWLESTVPPHRLVLHADSFITLQIAAEAGRGLAILPCCLGDPSARLVRVSKVPEFFSTGLWIAAHKDMVRSPKIQAAIAYFLHTLRGDRELLEGQSSC